MSEFLIAIPVVMGIILGVITYLFLPLVILDF